MKSGRFFPYPVNRGGLSLIVAEVAGGSADHDDRADLYGLGMGRFSVALRLEIETGAIEQIVEAHGRAPDEILLVSSGIASRHRSVLGRFTPESQSSELVFDRSDYVGTLEVHAAATIEDPGGLDRLVAFSPSIRVNMDDPDVAGLGSTLPIRWEKFSESDALRDQQNNLYVVGRDSERQLPEIVLNSGYPELYEVLENKGTHGPRARIRDATFGLIATQVWTSLLAQALSALAVEIADSEPDVSALENLPEWERLAIEGWAPDLEPSRDASDTVQTIIDHLDSETAEDYALTVVPRAVQTRLNTGSAFTGQVYEFVQKGGH